jgi:hypothetical protein
LLDTVRRHQRGTADTLVQAVSDAVVAWTGGVAQDDATLLAVAVG